MKYSLIMLFTMLAASNCIKISWSELNGGHSMGGGGGISMGGGGGISMGGGGGLSMGGSDWVLITDSSSVNGYGVGQILALYVKQLTLQLTNSQNEIRLVRLEKDCYNNYKLLIRIKDCYGNYSYIGMYVSIVNGEVVIKKFLQTDDLNDIWVVFKFIDCNLYDYGNFNGSDSCENSIIVILRELCAYISSYQSGSSGSSLQIISNNGHGNGGCSGGNCYNNGGNGGGYGGGNNGGHSGCIGGNCHNNGGHGGGYGGGNNGGHSGCIGGNCHNGGMGSGGSSMTATTEGLELKIKVPGHMNPTGKTILLGSSKPKL